MTRFLLWPPWVKYQVSFIVLNKLINGIYRLSRFALLVLLMVAAKMHFKEQAGSDQKRQAGRQTCQAREYYMGKYHCTVDLLFDGFGIGCLITGNFCFYLRNRLMQTSQTGGQWCSDTSSLVRLSDKVIRFSCFVFAPHILFCASY